MHIAYLICSEFMILDINAVYVAFCGTRVMVTLLCLEAALRLGLS